MLYMYLNEVNAYPNTSINALNEYDVYIWNVIDFSTGSGDLL